jgi:hypothetical protein
METEPLCVIWKELVFDAKHVWYLRSLRPNGKLFGEVTDHTARNQWTVETEISSNSCRRIFDIAETISQLCSIANQDQVREGWIGVLARGLPSKPEILMRLYPESDEQTKSEILFLELIEILRPYLHRSVSQAKFSNAT